MTLINLQLMKKKYDYSHYCPSVYVLFNQISKSIFLELILFILIRLMIFFFNKRSVLTEIGKVEMWFQSQSNWEEYRIIISIVIYKFFLRKKKKKNRARLELYKIGGKISRSENNLFEKLTRVLPRRIPEWLCSLQKKLLDHTLWSISPNSPLSFSPQQRFSRRRKFVRTQAWLRTSVSGFRPLWPERYRRS